MNRTDILQALDREITKLQHARALLAEAPDMLPDGGPKQRSPGRPKASAKAAADQANAAIPKKRTMSAEGRARIAAAQKARWAKPRNIAKKKAPSQ